MAQIKGRVSRVSQDGWAMVIIAVKNNICESNKIVSSRMNYHDQNTD